MGVILDKLSADQPSYWDHLDKIEGMGTLEKISYLASPVFLFLSFAGTVPYQLYQIKVVVNNMRTYEVGDPKRMKDPKTIIFRRSLSALGGVVGAIGCVLGTGIFFAVGGSLKVATGVMCLYTNSRLYYEGHKELKELLKQENPDEKAVQTAQYKMVKGKAGFLSSASYIGYFALTIAAGVCPPVVALGMLVGALSLLCAYLEREGGQEQFYKDKAIIAKVGWKNWARGHYNVSDKGIVMESLGSNDKNNQALALALAKRLESQISSA